VGLEDFVAVNVTAAWHELNLLPIVFLAFPKSGWWRVDLLLNLYWLLVEWATFGGRRPQYGAFSILRQQFSWILRFLCFCSVFWLVCIWQLGNNETNDYWMGG